MSAGFLFTLTPAALSQLDDLSRIGLDEKGGVDIWIDYETRATYLANANGNRVVAVTDHSWTGPVEIDKERRYRTYVVPRSNADREPKFQDPDPNILSTYRWFRTLLKSDVRDPTPVEQNTEYSRCSDWNIPNVWSFEHSSGCMLNAAHSILGETVDDRRVGRHYKRVLTVPRFVHPSDLHLSPFTTATGTSRILPGNDKDDPIRTVPIKHQRERITVIEEASPTVTAVSSETVEDCTTEGDDTDLELRAPGTGRNISM